MADEQTKPDKVETVKAEPEVKEEKPSTTGKKPDVVKPEPVKPEKTVKSEPVAESDTPTPVEEKSVSTVKPVSRPETDSGVERKLVLENARLKAMLAHPEISANDFDTLCGATSPEGIEKWADKFAHRISNAQPVEPTTTAGQTALSQVAAHQGGVATPASDEFSPSNLYERARKNARPRK